MTEKRYYVNKKLLHENEVHDKRCHRFMDLNETVEHMNNEYWKYKQLKKSVENLKETIVKISTAYQKKYNDTIVNLVNEDIDCFVPDLKDRNCYICKNRETYSEGDGYGFVSLCDKDCMNTDGYFDYKYHRFKHFTVCPFFEWDGEEI